MIYVRRNDAGEVVALCREALSAGVVAEGGWVAADDKDPGVLAFCAGLTAGDDELSRSDAGFIRVLEDVIDLLIERSVILFTDLPAPAQEKLLARRKARAGRRDLGLLDDESDEGLI